jgi:predicted lactoylglutathione lyase
VQFWGFTLAHNAGSKNEVDLVFQLVLESGTKILIKSSDAFRGGYSGYFADPDGHPWEIVWNPEFLLN